METDGAKHSEPTHRRPPARSTALRQVRHQVQERDGGSGALPKPGEEMRAFWVVGSIVVMILAALAYTKAPESHLSLLLALQAIWLLQLGRDAK